MILDLNEIWHNPALNVWPATNTLMDRFVSTSYYGSVTLTGSSYFLPSMTQLVFFYRQFLTDVAWMDRDVLIIDTPPGTSDEHITVMENLRNVLPKVDGAILVTTPQVNLQ